MNVVRFEGRSLSPPWVSIAPKTKALKAFQGYGSSVLLVLGRRFARRALIPLNRSGASGEWCRMVGKDSSRPGISGGHLLLENIGARLNRVRPATTPSSEAGVGRD